MSQRAAEAGKRYRSFCRMDFWGRPERSRRRRETGPVIRPARMAVRAYASMEKWTLRQF